MFISFIQYSRCVFIIKFFLFNLLLLEHAGANGGPRRRGTSSPVTVRVDTGKAIWQTDELFFSLGLDSNLIRHRWQNFDFRSARLHTLARGLSPARVRLMGTDGDRMTFRCDDEKLCYEPRLPFITTLFPHSNFSMTCEDWDNINRFAQSVNWRVMFGLNAQLRSNGVWDSSDARKILDHSIKHGYAENLDFELGNEPDLYPSQFPHVINGSQLANDYQTLKQLLMSSKYQQHYGKAKLAGPAIATAISTKFLIDYLQGAGKLIDAVTWHQYYGGSELSHVDNATDPRILDQFPALVEFITTVVKQSPRPDVKIWVGETSSTSSPVGSNLYETFAAGFMLVDKLGQSAALGMDLVVRQTFYGFWFALVDHGILPTPNYWISYLYKQLVGRRVLQVAKTGDSEHVRLYAHCATSSRYPAGAVTIYGMNLYDEDVTLNLTGGLAGHMIHQWLLTPYGVYTGLTAKYLAVNGQIVLMPDDKMLPTLPPAVLPPGAGIRLPAKSLAFYVIPQANAKACMSSS